MVIITLTCQEGNWDKQNLQVLLALLKELLYLEMFPYLTRSIKLKVATILQEWEFSSILLSNFIVYIMYF